MISENDLKDLIGRVLKEIDLSAAGSPDGTEHVVRSVTSQVETAVSIVDDSELMKNDGTGIILATGGSAMVKAAYRSGNPALGVGPGNVPAFIERDRNRSG